MWNNKVEYSEIARAKISNSRSMVVSNCSRGGFTIAQQLEIKEGETSTSVFLKGAFHVDDIQGLANIRDAINLAIRQAEANGK